MKHPYWHYFVALSDDVAKIARFVEPTPGNYKTYSIEFARLYLAIGSEIDVVAKQLCEKIEPMAKLPDRPNIDNYRTTILPKLPELPGVQVEIPRNGISLSPWQEWANGKNPSWWGKYNEVKHKRHEVFEDANLENTLNALAGLLVMVGYFYGEDLARCWLSPSPSANFIQFGPKYYSGVGMGRNGSVVGYLLPGITKPVAGHY
jgi:hypothetical protein